MPTRAVLAYTRGTGDWRGVWNHWSGHTQHLGKEIIDRIALLDGDLEQFCRRWIDRCPEGWSDFTTGERGQDGGVWSGTFEDGVVVFSRGSWPAPNARETKSLPDAHYAYVLDLTSRRLLGQARDDYILSFRFLSTHANDAVTQRGYAAIGFRGAPWHHSTSHRTGNSDSPSTPEC